MTPNHDDIHQRFAELLEVYITGGLDAEAAVELESHAAGCPVCAAALKETKQMDASLQSLFAGIAPRAQFEDDLIGGLQSARPIHPWIRRAAVGVAAAVLLAAVGRYGGDRVIPHGHDRVAGGLAKSNAATHAAAVDPGLRTRSLSTGLAGASSTALGRNYTWAELDSEGAVSHGSQGWGFRGEPADANGRASGLNDKKNYFGINPKQADANYVFSQPVAVPTAANGAVILEGTLTAGVKPANEPVQLYFRPQLGVALGDGDGERSFKRLPQIQKDSLALPIDEGNIARSKAAEVTGKPIALGAELPIALGNEKPAEAPPPDAAKQKLPTGGDSGNVSTTQIAARKIIRTGKIEFEVDSFDSAFNQITKIAGEESGFVASTDSEKLANGKVRGTITLRCAPEHLDTLVLKLRGLGDLKTQRIAAQDVTKQFTDFESQLKAARAMEERLLEIIKTGKGQVKDLVEAEKQLGVYREKIETVEGELRFMNSQVALSTLNITLMERDIKTPFAALETEQINAGIETEDVEKARTEALKMIDAVKGRVIESDLKKLDAGQLAATIVAEVAPDAAGSLGDQFKQLGRVARWDAERKQTAQGGTGAAAELRSTAKLERHATRFSLSLYNLANIAPRQTTSLTLVAVDVEAAYKTVLAAINGDGKSPPIGRIVTSNLSAQKSDQFTGSITLEVKSDQTAAIEAALRSTGSVLHLAVTENPDQNGVTSAKRGYSIALIAAMNVPARETQTLAVASKDVPATYNKLLSLLRDPKGSAHVINSQLVEQQEDNVNGSVDFEIPLAARAAIDAVMADGKQSDIVTRNVTRSADTENTLAEKVHLTVTIAGADHLPPREMTRLTLEASDVQKALDTAAGLGGSDTRVLDRTLTQDVNGKSTAHVVFDVPIAGAQSTLDQLRTLGKVRAAESQKNPKVTSGPLARARFEVELTNAESLVAPEEGIGFSIRAGLKKALGGLLWSVQLVVIGLVLVGPFAIVLWAGVKLFRRGQRKTPPRGVAAT